MRLALLHPELPACDDCVMYEHDVNWQIVRQPRRTGPPMKRRGPPPCRICPKIPLGVLPAPANAAELDARGWTAYQHYLRCKAVGRFPDDEAVEVVAGVISQVEADCERMLEERRMGRLTQAMVMSNIAPRRRTRRG